MSLDRKSVFSILFIALIFVAVLAFGWWMYRWQYSTADTILENWARQNNYKVLDKQKANVGTGPEAVRAGNKQVMYRIVVEDQNGARRSGLAKIGNETTGTLSDEIAVEWDK
jgi:hypothetical protein